MRELRKSYGKDGLGVYLASQTQALASNTLAFSKGMISQGNFISGARRNKSGRLTSLSIVHVPTIASESLAIAHA